MYIIIFWIFYGVIGYKCLRATCKCMKEEKQNYIISISKTKLHHRYSPFNKKSVVYIHITSTLDYLNSNYKIHNTITICN